MIDWVRPGDEWPFELPVLDPERLRDPPTWVSFHVSGDDLEPDVLTSRTGIVPWFSARKGESTGQGEPLPAGLWNITLRFTDDDDEGAFQQLLAVLEPHGEFLRSLAGVRMSFHVHTILGFSPDWTAALSARTLQGIAALGAGLSIDLTCGRCY